MADQKVGIVIDARDQASAVIGRARVELDRYNAEIARLKKEAAGGADVSKALGAAMLGQSQAAATLRNSLQNVTTGQSLLANASRGAADALAAQAGPLAGLARGFAAMASPAGLAVAGVLAVTGAVVAGAKGIADYQEQLDLAAESTGLTTGQLAGLRVAAAESGRTFEQIRPALDFFTRKIGEVAAGTPEAVKQFSKLGIAIRDTSGAIRPTGDILKDAQAALSAMGSQAERSAAAMDLFGRSGASAINVLLTPLDEAEAKARKLGLALGPDAEKVARQADAAFDSLSTSVAGIGNAFGLTAARIVNEFLPAVARAASQVAIFLNAARNTGPEGFIKNLWNPFKLFLSGGDPSKIPGLVSDFASSQTSGNPWDWSIAEGNRPWGPAAAKPESLPAKPWDESQGGTFNTNPQFFTPKFKHLDLNAIDGGWSATGSDPRFDEMFAGARKELERLTESAMGFIEPAEEARLAQEAFTKSVEDGMLSGLANSLTTFFVNAITHVAELDEAFQALGEEILNTLATAGVKAGLGALFPGLSAFLQGGGTVQPIRAQSGLVIAGTRGVDTVPALLGRGETVISHAETDDLRSFKSEARAFFRAMLPPMQAPVAAGAGGNVTVHLTYSGGGFSDADGLKLEQFFRDKGVPILKRVLSKGGRV